MKRERIIERLRQARHLVVFTGAGMSADSGVPTFRDRLTGLWAHTEPSEVATPQAFRRDPQRVCDGYAASRACDPWATRDDLAKLRLEAGPVPRCPGCGALLRPDVVWFNEMLDPAVVDAAVEAVDDCDAMLCVGASLEVQPAASLPWRALSRGATVLEINPQATPLTPHVAAFRGTAAQVLPELLARVWR